MEEASTGKPLTRTTTAANRQSGIRDVEGRALRKRGGRVPVPDYPGCVSRWRIGKQPSDRLARDLAWTALFLFLVMVVLATINSMYGDAPWTYRVSARIERVLPLLLLASVAIRNRRDVLVVEAITARTEAEARRARRQSHSRAVRLQGWLFVLAASIGVLMFYVGVNMGVAAADPGSAIRGFTLLIPVLVSYFFSRKLLRAGVSDLRYIKGTSVGREILVFWMLATAVSVQRLVAPDLNVALDKDIGNTLLWALSGLALTRVASAGYAEYREALQPDHEDGHRPGDTSCSNRQGPIVRNGQAAARLQGPEIQTAGTNRQRQSRRLSRKFL